MNSDKDLKELPPLIKAIDAAKLLGITTRTLRRWARRGKITCLRTAPAGSGRVLIRRSELTRVINAMEEPNF